MIRGLLLLSLFSFIPAHATTQIFGQTFGKNVGQNPADLITQTTVRDVTAEYDLHTESYSDKIPGDFVLATPTPNGTKNTVICPKGSIIPCDPNTPGPTGTPDPNNPFPDPNNPFPDPTNPDFPPSGHLPGSLGANIDNWNNTINGVAVTLDQLMTLGSRVWQFVLDNRPNATFQTLNTSIVPGGATDWQQLTGWKREVVKVYRVEFKNTWGKAGSFEYRVSFIPGGGFKNKGKFLGNISFLPRNLNLNTGRSLDIKAELSPPLNYGTAKDPIAAVQLFVTWTTPTITTLQVNSAEYLISGDGVIQDNTNGN